MDENVMSQLDAELEHAGRHEGILKVIFWGGIYINNGI